MRDFFLCHASEDKNRFVEPLANELNRRGFSIWIDNVEVTFGDNLYEKVNEGIRDSKFVIACLSEFFIRKSWPKKELYSALDIEKKTGEKRVLPLMLDDPEKILSEYPLLSEKVYLRFENNVHEIGEILEQVISGKAKVVSNANYSVEDREDLLKHGYRKRENMVKKYEGTFKDSSLSVNTDISEGTHVLVEVSIVDLEEMAVDIGASTSVRRAIQEVMPDKSADLLGNEAVMKALKDFAVAVGGGRQQLKEKRERIPADIGRSGKLIIENVKWALDGMKAELFVTLI